MYRDFWQVYDNKQYKPVSDITLNYNLCTNLTVQVIMNRRLVFRFMKTCILQFTTNAWKSSLSPYQGNRMPWIRRGHTLPKVPQKNLQINTASCFTQKGREKLTPQRWIKGVNVLYIIQKKNPVRRSQRIQAASIWMPTRQVRQREQISVFVRKESYNTHKHTLWAKCGDF